MTIEEAQVALDAELREKYPVTAFTVVTGRHMLIVYKHVRKLGMESPVFEGHPVHWSYLNRAELN